MPDGTPAPIKRKRPGPGRPPNSERQQGSAGDGGDVADGEKKPPKAKKPKAEVGKSEVRTPLVRLSWAWGVAGGTCSCSGNGAADPVGVGASVRGEATRRRARAAPRRRRRRRATRATRRRRRERRAAPPPVRFAERVASRTHCACHTVLHSFRPSSLCRCKRLKSLA